MRTAAMRWKVTFALLWGGSVVGAFLLAQWQPERESQTSGPAPVSIAAPAASPVSQDPQMNFWGGAPPETFDPAHRPSWQFSPKMDAGRRMILKTLLNDSNDNEDRYAAHMFSGLDAQGRAEALDLLQTVDSIPVRKAGYAVIFQDWALEDPAAAIEAASGLADQPGGEQAAIAAWATALAADPSQAASALAQWPHPAAWDEVMEAIDDKATETDDYRPYATILGALIDADVCTPEQLFDLTATLAGETWGSLEETFAFFQKLHPADGAIIDVEMIRWQFQSFMAGHLDEPASLTALTEKIAQTADPRLRAAMILGLGESWIELDAHQALLATDLLPPGLREQVHSELFESLISADPANAADYFALMPPGDLRDHLLASSASGWIQTWGFDSLLAQLPAVESEVVVRNLIETAAQEAMNLPFRTGGMSVNIDESLRHLIDLQDRIPSGLRRKQFLEQVFTSWATSGMDDYATIQAHLNQQSFFTPTERSELDKRLQQHAEARDAMREEAARRRAELESEDLIELSPFTVDDDSGVFLQ